MCIRDSVSKVLMPPPLVLLLTLSPSRELSVKEDPDFEAVSRLHAAGTYPVVKSDPATPAALSFTPDESCFFLLDEDDWPCLLYTSPSPRDRTRSRMPSSA
eukprot:TRINITY_DN4927_c0_g1_i1.p1 TRINITY_DN4927_c0_g1~~TRINITY_DN4927_c0_g1_i1.p1  ORF type:complete len:101 (-),score=26.78 TRINITY_DN4927_c0_g1_i1:41-343(-)